MVNIHPTSDIQSDKIGEGTTVWQFCIILKDAIIGKNCNINCHVFIENKVKIGDNVTIKPGVQIWDGVTIENNVFVGPNVTFTNDLIPRSKHHRDEYDKTLIKNGASIGANSTIIAGNTIGENALIGAGSVITKNVPANTVWFGNPATQRGIIDGNGVITYK